MRIWTGGRHAGGNSFLCMQKELLVSRYGAFSFRLASRGLPNHRQKAPRQKIHSWRCCQTRVFPISSFSSRKKCSATHVYRHHALFCVSREYFRQTQKKNHALLLSPSITMGNLRSKKQTWPRSQEVVWCSPADHGFASSRAGIELQESVLQMFINFHDGSLITTSVTIIGGTENGHNVPVLAPVVSLHDQLMCSRHEGEAVVVVERFGDVLPECIACTSWTDTPSTSIVGVTP